MADELNPAPLPLADLYTDGSCVPNPGAGAWAYVLNCPGGEKWYACGRVPESTTNQRMELQAVIEGLRRLPNAHKVNLETDSANVANGINEWLENWRRRGQLERNDIANADLWCEIDGLLHVHDVSAKHISDKKRHAELKQCDRMAGEMAGRRSKR
jgi:ribonuclease HI